MPVTALYAGLLAPLFIFLSARVIMGRRNAKVALGDGGNSDLQRRMRVHANFTEYVPLVLLLMALAEYLKTDARLLHALGAALLLGRIIHAYGLSQTKEMLMFRVTGVGFTFSALLIAAAACMIASARSGFGL